MDGVLNVKDSPFNAKGDGTTDDRAAIQAAINALAVPPTRVPQAIAVYFPPGVYRVDGPVEMNYVSGSDRRRIPHFRLFGESGRGAGVLGDGRGAGAVLRQHTNNTPIFVFRLPDTAGWEVERLGFTWATQQGPPPGLGTTGYTNAGAVALLFSGVPGSTDPVNYYWGRIAHCSFSKGWRGVSIDDAYLPGQGRARVVAVWDTHLDGLVSQGLRGAAVSLLNGPGAGIGMPNNSLRNTFVENYALDNVEDQVRLGQQGNFSMENVTMEASKHRVLFCVDCTMVMRSTSVEHAAIRAAYAKMFYFGGGTYVVDVLGVDGYMDGRDRNNPNLRGFTSIINAQGADPDPSTGSLGSPCSVVISGVRIYPFPTEFPPPPQGVSPLDQYGGFLPRYEPAVLLDGAPNVAFRLLDRPFLPVFSETERSTWDGLDYDLGPYRELQAWRDDFGPIMTPVIHAPAVKALRTIDFPSVPPGSVVTRELGECIGPVTGDARLAPVPGARPGDLVTLGPPPNFPAGLVATGAVVADDCVQIRVANPTGNAINPPSGAWTVEAHGSAASGGPQVVEGAAAYVPPRTHPLPLSS